MSYTQNRKLGNLGKYSFTSNFDSSCNLRSRNNKNELRHKLKGQDMLLEGKKKIPEISEFSILSSTQGRNSEISESFLLLQILTVIFGFSDISLLTRRLLLPSRFCNLLVVTKKLMTSTYFKQVM